MMKVKDGYKKLIGTSYSGSADNLLLSNGGDIPLTSLFTALTNDNNQISITVGGTNKKLTVAYATKASQDADGNVITSTYATKTELNATKYWANVPISATSSNTTKPTLHPDFAFNVAANTIIAGGINKAIASPLAKYLWHDILSFGVNSWPTVYVSSDGGSTWSTSTDINLQKKLFIQRDDQSVTVLDNTKTAIRWVWNNSQFHACQAAYLNIGFAYSASQAKFNIVWDVSTDGTTWSTGFSTNNVAYTSSPYWFYVNNTWSNIKYARLTLTRTSAAGTSANLSTIKLLSYRWGNQGRGGEYEYPYNWDASQNIYPRVSNASSLGLASNKWSNVYATTFTGDLEGNAKTATSANSAKSDAAGNEISTTYAPLASPTFTGTPSAPTAAAGTNTTQIATTAFVNNAVGAGFAANDAMLFKGTIGTGGTVTALPNTHSIGWTYRVITAGTYAGQSCEIGDLIICIADGTAANNAHWTVAQGNISNMSTVVAGPSSVTSGNIAIFDGTTGKKIKDGGAKISDFLTKTTYEWNKEIAFGSTGKLCIGKFVMYDSAVIVTISATTNLTYHGVLVIATQNHGTASGGNIKATVYGDASNTIAPNIYIYSHPANDGLVEVYFSPTAYSKNLIHIQAQSLALRGTVSYANLAFDICTSITAIPDTATLKPTNALTETFMGKSGVSVSNLLTSGSKIGTITINGTANDIYQTSLTWDNIANKPTSFTPSTHTHDYAPYQSWTASVKGVTWSRLCYVKVGNSTVGSKFILNIAATRNSVVYNDTYIITAHHLQNGKIAKIGGCNYSYGYQIRINTDSTGNCYVELYDNCNSATTSTSQNVYCRLLSLFTGDVTKYTAFTDGTTLASGFKTVTTLTTTNEDFQGTVSASRLTTTSKTAWGQTYWTSNGVPTSISGNMTGVGSISMSDALTLTGTNAETAQVKFSRTSYNYITFPSTGYLALATAANGSSIVAAVDSSSISPYENNKGSLGKADKVWNAIYATTFVGNVSGNVSGSAGSVAWGNVTGKPSSFTPASHTHYSLATEGDKRNDNTTPDLYKNSLIFRGLKYSNKINSPASSTYSYLLGLRGWSDKSGGGAHELAFNDVGIQRRNSTSTSDAWGTWKTLLDSENFTTFVTTDAIGAAPSEHSHAYLPLTGGTVTGPIEFNTGTLNNNYNEGVRITAAANNWAGITFGSTGLAGAPTNGWFAAKNPNGQFIITPDNSSNTTGLTLNKNGEALWRNNKIYHAGNLTSLPASDVYDWAKAATKPSYAFSEITPGNATIGDGANSINLRTNSSWASSIYHQTTVDEAVVFLNKGKDVSGTANYTTSWIFAYGTPSERPAWNALTPALQIKGACVAINKLIGSKTGGAYNLDVNGSANAVTLYENGVRVSVTGHAHDYLPLAGGTMTGKIIMNTGTGIAMKYTSSGNDVWMYPNGADTYGIRYFEGNPDAMAFSATGNNSTKTGADLCINGNGDGTVTIRGKNIWHAGNSGQVKWCNFWSTNSTAISTSNISGAAITTNCNDMIENGHWYYQSNGPTTTLGASTGDGALYSQAYNTNWVAQIAQDYRNGNLFTRGKNSGTWTAWKKVAYINDLPTKVSQLTNDSGFVTGGPYLPLAGGTLNDSAKLKLTLWGARSLTLSGNSIDLDMSLDTGTYAGAFATIKDSKQAVTTMLGFYGSHGNGLYHIFMGGSYDDPAMKMDPSGNFTFKNTITGTITNANAAGTALRLTSPYAYEDNSQQNVITNNTTADTLFSDSYSFSAMMSNHPLWNNYATVWNFSGYTKYGGTQFAVMYNTQPVRAAIRTFTQTGSKWGDWVELLTTANFTNHITLAGLGIETWATNKGFATESYVTNKVAEIITGGTVKLDGYATEEYVNNTFLPKANLSVSGGGSTWKSSLTITLNGTETTLTLPANPNTDSKVQQVVTTTSNTSWRPLLLGASYSDSTPSTFSTTTSNIYASHIMRVQPNTGSLETSGTITASSFIGTATHATNAFYIKTQKLGDQTFYHGFRAWFKWIDESTLGLKIAKSDSETDTTISTYKFKADLATYANTAGYADVADTAEGAIRDQNGNVIDTTYLKLSGGTLTGGVTMSMANTSDVMYYANATNKGYNIGFGVGTSGNRGIYDSLAGGWVLKIDSSNKATFSGTAACADKVNVTATSIREAFYIPFVNAVSGSRTVYVNSSLMYDPSTNTITATTFNGNATSSTTASTATSATTASKLSTVSKTAWGQTYWTSGGVPTDISGDITGKYFLIKDAANPYLKFTSSAGKTAVFHVNALTGLISVGPTTSTALQISAAGAVTLPSTLTVTSNITSSGTISATGGVFETSDARLKYFIKDIDVDFTRLKEIPKKYFIWKNDKQQTVQIGTSAQNLKNIYPELVQENSSGELSVSYNKLSIVALKGIDELYNLIVKLQEENKELRQLITNLNKK